MAGRLSLFSAVFAAFLFLQFFIVLSPAQEDSADVFSWRSRRSFAGRDWVGVKASVDKYKIAQDEPITFQIEISGNFNSSPQIDLPDWKKDFNVVSTAQSQSLNIKGKKKIRQVVLIYVLTAKSVGRLDIGEAT